MDVFQLRDEIIDDYAAYVSSFIEISDDRIRDAMQATMSSGTAYHSNLF